MQSLSLELHNQQTNNDNNDNNNILILNIKHIILIILISIILIITVAMCRHNMLSTCSHESSSDGEPVAFYSLRYLVITHFQFAVVCNI